MASISNDANDTKRILFVDPIDKQRKAIRLGKVSKKHANEVLDRVEKLIACKFMGSSMDPELALWVENRPEPLIEKLRKVGLLSDEPAKAKSESKSLKEYLESYVAKNGIGKKPATLVVWQQVISLLLEYIPPETPIDEITRGHCNQFSESLRQRGLASATISKRIAFAKQFFQYAVDWKMIEENPFDRLKVRVSSAKSNVFVDRDTITRVFKHCDQTWKTIIGLSRFGGLRCPSEVLSLKWTDIDWDSNRMRVPEPKVEHHEGRGIRTVPLFPELRAILDVTRQQSPMDAEFVVNKPGYREAAMRPGGWANANLRTQFLKILDRAGVDSWDRLFHSMRASRETELKRDFPIHVVCSWMGNSEAVATRNYLLVTEEDFTIATRQTAAQKTAHAAQKAAQHTPARKCTASRETKKGLKKSVS